VLLTQNPSDLPEIEPSGKLIPLDGKLTTETNGLYPGPPAFASHTVSLLIDGQWAVPNFQKAGIDFGVALFPKGDAGTVTSIGIGVGVGALLKTTQAQDDAGVQFLKFLASPAEGAHLTAQSGGLPVDPSQLKQPELQTHIAGDPYYKVFSDNEASGVVRPLTPAYNAVSQVLYTEISKALQDKETPADALANAARKGDSALSNQG
jgi:ABC-type glycerol-3-phosphate transport system substrate-binding protein